MSRTTKSTTKKRLLGALTAILIAGTTTLAGGAPAQAVTAPVGTGSAQEIRNQHSSMCLDNWDSGTQPGTEVRQYTCGEGDVQRWAVTDLGTGYAEIKNVLSGLCLDNLNAATAPGSPVALWTCNGGTNQQWRITDVGGGANIVNRQNELCLEIPGYDQIDGTAASQWTCNGGKNQRWVSSDPTWQKITWSLERSSNPSADELDAYDKITYAMDRAVERYNRLDNIHRHLTVSYAPWVETADGNISGSIRFGWNRGYMQEGTALHEMSHTFGVGQSNAFFNKCQYGGWDSALPLLRTWDGSGANINCSGVHIYPYGLNYNNEFSGQNFDRHVKLVQSMLTDGM
ncbi:RICIN domain-containing protein [Microbacterium proteolyticum]|uniref:RICIN domain-containing protein n=1 Tax=Microbacterium proteolyticum TaxID=1572644 RepID=UPI001FAE263D|nr:RICIN domain-containing protein [Microbacterium proteolyticum]MCI9857610.1 ricin-type beta-trefoil lectin domain protein [Microbacterium proteolyticum]